MKKILVGLFLLIFVQLCAKSAPIDIGDGQIYVKVVLGSNYTETVDSDGNCSWVYENVPIEYSFGKNKKANLFLVKFDKSKNVLSYSYYIKEN